jgi:hypothetical protein
VRAFQQFQELSQFFTMHPRHERPGNRNRSVDIHDDSVLSALDEWNESIGAVLR